MKKIKLLIPQSKKDFFGYSFGGNTTENEVSDDVASRLLKITYRNSPMFALAVETEKPIAQPSPAVMATVDTEPAAPADNSLVTLSPSPSFEEWVDSLKGIGIKTIEKLLAAELDSIEKLQSVTVDDLMAAGLSENQSQIILNGLDKE